MSEAAWLDKCRADLLRSRTACENQKHIIIDLEAKLAAAEADAARYRWLLDDSLCGWTFGDGLALVVPDDMPLSEVDAAIDAAIGRG